MAGKHVKLSGSDRPRKSGAVRVRDVDPQSEVEVTVTLRGPKLPDLKPGESISRDELKSSYAASPEDMDKLETGLKRYGLKIEEASPLTRSARVRGTAKQMDDAFHTRLGIYETKAQGAFRGREGALEIPSDLDGLVTGVFGLDQRRVARRQPGVPHQANAAQAAAQALSPADLERRYDFPDGRGSGQTIGIAEFGGAYFENDLKAFCAQQGHPMPTVSQVGLGVKVLSEQQVMGLPESERSEVLDASGEVNMDVQIVAGLCPEAEIVVYFTQFSQKGWVDLINEVIKGDQASPITVSVSWGLAEDSADFSDAARTAIDERLQAAAALGVTVCVSAGDDGSGDQVSDGKAHVNFPASSGNVLAVGGTMLKGEDEVVWWQSPGERQDGGGSTGGGVSVVFDRPSWQNVQVESLNPDSIDGRVVPDIAALAGPPYYQLVFMGKAAPNGGTSASAPLWASLIARVAAAADPPAAPVFIAPLLYQNGNGGKPLGDSACVDITQGDNTTPTPGKGYAAGPGFDAVTGWGVPNGAALLASR
jgi:kumamolisin